jgi:hypothetical protein
MTWFKGSRVKVFFFLSKGQKSRATLSFLSFVLTGISDSQEEEERERDWIIEQTTTTEIFPETQDAG